MKHKMLWSMVCLLVVAGLLAGGFGCAAPAAPGGAPVTKTVTTTATKTITSTVTAPATTVTAGAEEPEVIHWTMQAMMAESPPVGYFQDYFLRTWIDRGYPDWVEEATEGRLVIDVVPAGSVFPGKEAVVNMKSGVIEASSSALVWLTGTIPECLIGKGMPFTWQTAYDAYDCYHQYGLLKYMEEAFDEHNIVFIPAPGQEVQGIIGTFPMPDIASLKDRTLRVTSTSTVWTNEVGVNGISMAYGDLYMGMKLGTIEGATTGALALENIKLKEVATDMLILEGYNCPCMGMLFNKDAFNELPQDIQDTLLRDSKYFFAMTACEEQRNQEWIVQKTVQDYGLNLHYWSEADYAKARTICEEKVWAEVASNSPRCAEMVDLVKNYMREYNLID